MQIVSQFLIEIEIYFSQTDKKKNRNILTNYVILLIN